MQLHLKRKKVFLLFIQYFDYGNLNLYKMKMKKLIETEML